MEPVQLSLRDVHLPESIGWWPPAVGWWLLAIAILLICICCIWLYKHVTRKTAVKTARNMLSFVQQNVALNDQEKLEQVSAVMRRVAMSVSPRNETAGLVGLNWLEYLDSTVKGNPFTSGAGRYLANTHYQQFSSSDLDINAVIGVCEDWLEVQKEYKK